MPRRPRCQAPGAIYHVTSRGTEGRDVFLDDLDVGMHRLNSAHANYFNRRHDHVGHLFQSRYAAELIERESHLLESCRYVVLNPVRAGLCRRPGRWQWSSYRATAGYVPSPEYLAADWVLGQFGNAPRRAALRYVEFVADGIGDASGRAVSRGLAPGPGPKGRART